MRLLILCICFISAVGLSRPTQQHCERDEITIGFTQVSKKTSLFRVERLDGKPLFPSVTSQMKGFTLLFKNGECYSGTYCNADPKEAEFQAWDLNGYFIDVPAPVHIKSLLTYRLHFKAVFEIDGKKVQALVQKEVGKKHCIGNAL